MSPFIQNHCLKLSCHCHCHFKLRAQSYRTKMALSSLTFTTPRAQTYRIFSPKLSSSVKPTVSSSCSSCSSVCTIKKAMSNIGVGVLAASVVALSPLDANATRIEYYATVGDPLCEFTYAPSGLGYCDIDAGFGAEAPYGELINVESAAAMRSLQPQVKAVQQRYAGDQERVQIETARTVQIRWHKPICSSASMASKVPDKQFIDEIIKLEQGRDQRQVSKLNSHG